MDLCDFTTRTFCTFGYCRSTVGGYDIWESETTHILNHIIKCSNICSTSINVMNYTAVIECLSHINNMTEYTHEYANMDARPRVNIVCGCFMVCQQLNKTMQSNALKSMYLECEQLVNILYKRVCIKFVYDQYLVPLK